MTRGLPVVLDLVRHVGDLVEPSDLLAALPFAEQLVQLAGDRVAAIGPLEDYVAACMQTTGADHWRAVFAAVTEEITIGSAGEELQITHGDLINIYAVPGFALGVALAMALAVTPGEAREIPKEGTDEGGER